MSSAELRLQMSYSHIISDITVDLKKKRKKKCSIIRQHFFGIVTTLLKLIMLLAGNVRP